MSSARQGVIGRGAAVVGWFQSLWCAPVVLLVLVVGASLPSEGMAFRCLLLPRGPGLLRGLAARHQRGAVQRGWGRGVLLRSGDFSSSSVQLAARQGKGNRGGEWSEEDILADLENAQDLKVDLNWKAEEGAWEDDGDLDFGSEDEMDARLNAAQRDADRGRVTASNDFSRDWDGVQGQWVDQVWQPDYKLDIAHGDCSGCGVRLQDADESMPGYLPPHVLERAMALPAALPDTEVVDDDVESSPQESDEGAICQRCHRLRNYGLVDEALRPGWSEERTLSPQHFKDLLKVVRQKKCVVITLVDLFDFHGSILPDILSIIGKNPLFVGANKVDLLPVDHSSSRVQDWVLQECRSFAGLQRLRNSDVHLISARTGQGVGRLLDSARALAAKRGCDIYVVGAANVGKSSMLNRLTNSHGDSGQASKKTKKKGKTQAAPMKRGITTSPLPGTTLDLVKMDVGGDVALYDTPGLILPHQLTSRLSSQDLKAVLPQKRIHHVSLRIAEEKALLVGGLARIELIEGRPFFFTAFVSDEVKLHVTSAANADAFMEKHIGGMLSPPTSLDDLDRFGEPVAHDFEVQGRGWKEAGSDIVLSGIGWVSITGAGACRIRVVAPKGVMVLQREPLMPFEARDTMGKSTGGRILKPAKKKGPKVPPKRSGNSGGSGRGGGNRRSTGSDSSQGKSYRIR